MEERKAQQHNSQRTILIAEDEEILAEVIATTLTAEGLKPIIAHNGEQALAQVRQQHPDLILLDVMMPGQSGLEVCSILKSDPATASIPVVLLTALADQNDLIAGITAGADEYLTKPFSPTELIDLINAALSGAPILPRFREPDIADMGVDQLTVYARELRELFEREQAERLALEEARMRLNELDQAKATFLNAVTHELLTPFAQLGLVLQILQRQSAQWSSEHRETLDNLATVIAGLYQRVNGVVKFAELVTKRRAPQPGYYTPDKIVPWAVQPAAILAQAREIDFRVFVPPGLPKIYVDPELLGEAIFQMAHNAVKFNLPGGQAQLRAFESRDWVVIEIQDTGVGLTPERLATLGQPLAQTTEALRRGQEGLGIGWAFVCYVAKVHGGRTHVVSPGPGRGSTFSLAVPVAVQEENA